ncbi:MAG: alpha/beta fold hydrolase [Acidisphaera sp.]|nr:alpha/beta fold hydrolase [Acidisphaera sp.]
MRRLMLGLLLLLVAAPARAQQEGVYTLPHFTFENGAAMTDMKVGYVTYGTLNAAKSNAVLLVPGTSSGRHWADDYVGPGKMYDTDKYYFVGVDPIGGGTSSQPKDGLGPDFPHYTIRDIVRAEHDLVTGGLGLSGLLAVAGPSMGSFQGVEWGVTYPGFAKGLILIVPAARSDNHFRSMVDAMVAMITLDPAYQGGKYTTNPTEGMRRAGTLYFPWLYSDAYLQTLTTDAQYQQALWAFGTAWSKVWDTNAILLRYLASRNHDASIPYGGDMRAALGRVTAKALMLVSMTDRTIPGYLSRELYAGLKDATWVEIPTIRGHLGGAAPLKDSGEYVFMADRIRPFLDSLGQ